MSYNYRGTEETGNGSFSTVILANTWEKVTYEPTSVLSVTQGAAGIIGKMMTSAGDMFYDDFVLYEGALDNTAPNAPSSMTVAQNSISPTTKLDLTWGAASGGIDGGGYMVVRYASAPVAADDPNVNGIYKSLKNYNSPDFSARSLSAVD